MRKNAHRIHAEKGMKKMRMLQTGGMSIEGGMQTQSKRMGMLQTCCILCASRHTDLMRMRMLETGGNM